MPADVVIPTWLFVALVSGCAAGAFELTWWALGRRR
jgi:hypothetical protein